MTDEDYAAGRVGALDIFEGRITGWTLAFASDLSKQPDSGIAVLLLTASVFEPMGGALVGSGKSEAKFCAAFCRTFPTVPGGDAHDIARMVCDLLRDGLFHEGFFKAGLILEHGKVPVELRDSAIVVDPRLFLEAVQAAFGGLCKEIRAADPNSNLRKSFDLYWTKKLEDHGKYMKSRFESRVATVATSTSTAAVMPPEMYIKRL